MMKKVIELLKAQGIDDETTLQHNVQIILQKRPGVPQIIEEREEMVSATVPIHVPAEKVNTVRHQIKDKRLMARINQTLGNGAQFRDYGQVDNVFDENKTVLKPKEGTVMLVDVWATWCGPCQAPMQHNEKMLTDNKDKWEGKVQIVAVSVDEDKDTIKERVNKKGWHSIKHLTLNGWDGDHGLVKDFGIQGIPFVCLVDKFGRINFKGHPSEINLEERITQLTEAKAPTEQAKAEGAGTGGPKVQELEKTFAKEAFEKAFGKSELVSFKAEIQVDWAKGQQQSKASVTASVFKGDVESRNLVKEYLGALGSVELEIKEVQYLNVPYEENPHCWKCQTLLKTPFYWLKWEKGIKYGCLNCVQAKSNKEGEHYDYPKNSVLLRGKWAKVPVKGFGNNIQPAKIEEVIIPNQFGCNNCGGCPQKIGEARYISLGCRAEPNYAGDFVDMCENCMVKLLDGDEGVEASMQRDYYVREQPWLRVLYNVKGGMQGYYEF